MNDWRTTGSRPTRVGWAASRLVRLVIFLLSLTSVSAFAPLAPHRPTVAGRAGIIFAGRAGIARLQQQPPPPPPPQPSDDPGIRVNKVQQRAVGAPLA